MALTASVDDLVARNENGLLGKHPTWARVRLGDVATVQNGFAFESRYFNTEGRGVPLLRIRDVVRGSTETWYEGPYDEAYVVQRDDLVTGMDGDFNHALWRGPPALLNNGSADSRLAPSCCESGSPSAPWVATWKRSTRPRHRSR